jgi:hypothetical protein
MISAIVAALLAYHPQPLPLDNISIELARTMDGKRVLVSLLVGKPTYTSRGSTMIGADDRPDGIERGAILMGKRLDVEGKRIPIVGTLRVIEHPVRVIGRELVLAWTEIRVEETR